MIGVANRSAARRFVHSGDSGDVEITEYFGKATEVLRGPQAILTTFTPDAVVRPHFHAPDQFQVFVDGSSRVGKRPSDPVSVMYNDGFSPYGPIVAGASGMSFFVLRARADVGAAFMPGSALPRRGGRQVIVPGQLSVNGEVTERKSVPLIEPHEDGLAAYEGVAPPFAALGEIAARSGGCYMLVISGSAKVGSETVEAGGLAFASAGDHLPPATAGEDGVHWLELQFPSE